MLRMRRVSQHTKLQVVSNRQLTFKVKNVKIEEGSLLGKNLELRALSGVTLVMVI
jgi:hypothetical protein